MIKPRQFSWNESSKQRRRFISFVIIGPKITLHFTRSLQQISSRNKAKTVPFLVRRKKELQLVDYDFFCRFLPTSVATFYTASSSIYKSIPASAKTLRASSRWYQTILLSLNLALHVRRPCDAATAHDQKSY